MAYVTQKKPGTKERQDEEQVPPTVAEFHAERRIKLIADLRTSMKWTIR